MICAKKKKRMLTIVMETETSRNVQKKATIYEMMFIYEHVLLFIY